MCRQPAMRAPLSGFGSAELFAQGHQAGHLGLGDGDLFAAPVGELDVLDLVISETTGDGHLENSCEKLCSNVWARFIKSQSGRQA